MAKKEVQKEAVTEEVKKEPTQVVEEVKEETIEISKSDLNTLLEKIEKQSEQIDVLFNAADKGRLFRAQNNNQGESLIRTVKVSRLKDDESGRYIVAWKMTRNNCEIINGKWIEDQKVLIAFDDGKDKEIDFIDFTRKVEKDTAEIVSKENRVLSNGKTEEILNVLFPSGKKLSILANYVN